MLISQVNAEDGPPTDITTSNTITRCCFAARGESRLMNIHQLEEANEDYYAEEGDSVVMEMIMAE